MDSSSSLGWGVVQLEPLEPSGCQRAILMAVRLEA